MICQGFTDAINVKFANTPNAAKSMMGLPLTPSYLPTIPTAQQPVLTAVPSIRQQLNRYECRPLMFALICLFFLQILFVYFVLQILSFSSVEKHMND